MMHTYTVYGLILRLPFFCSALTPAPPDEEPDVTVSYGSAPRALLNPAASSDDWTRGYTWQASPGRFLLQGGRRAGRFFVEGGTRVTIEPNPAAEQERLVYHLLHCVLAAILQQRGLLVLHANAVATDRGAVIVAGRSGAGKSTTLAALLNRGCVMLSDDITVLCRRPGRRIEVLPGIPRMHLYEDAAAGLGWDIHGLPRNPVRRAKTVVPAPGGLGVTPAPLRGLYILKPHNGALRLMSVCGADKFAVLQDCVYGPLLPQEHCGIFPLFAALAEQADIYYIERPVSSWTVPALTEMILNG